MRLSLLTFSIAVLTLVVFFGIAFLSSRINDGPIQIPPRDGASVIKQPTKGMSTSTPLAPRPIQYQPVPPGFKGPTGQPHINGPKGPPPNY